MRKFILALPMVHRTLHLALFILGLFVARSSSAQSFVNGNFEEGNSSWTGCPVEIGDMSTYGGVGTTNVAEVDGDLTTDPSDDRVLCQTISGFTVGGVYRITFDATRRGNGTPPSTVSVTMTMDGGALNNTITRTGGYAMVRQTVDFTATQTTHVFNVTPDFQGSFGMLFDNISLSYLFTLPIELVAFNGESTPDGVRLYWTTATELNNHHFNVQRSVDGLEFEDVLIMDGAGTSQTPHEYSTMDLDPIHGLAYYRLKQTDIGGGVNLFNTIPVIHGGRTSRDLALFPNPTNDGQLWLVLGDIHQETKVIVSVSDPLGRLVFREAVTMSPGAPVDLAALANLGEGSYWVSVNSADSSMSARVIVQ